jgi:AraC-like DNA-binding protein
LIETGLSKPLSIKVMASAIGRDPASLGTLFRERMGITVRRFIALRRIICAAESIRQGVKVEAVALEVGYRSKKNFYRQFRRHFGMTPGAYRRDS